MILDPEDFTADRFGPLARFIEQRQQWPRPFNSEHFFPTVQQMMRNGAMKVWNRGGGLLGGLFTHNLFVGGRVGIISFWWSLKAKESMQLFNDFESEARAQKCWQIYSSVFGPVRCDAMDRLYRRKGFYQAETVFCKFL